MTTEIATAEQTRTAVRLSLRRAGVTYAELEAQARSGHYSSIRARLAWLAIGDMPEWLR